jgi:hypothetical protein
MPETCNHLGRIEKYLPCPDPSCPEGIGGTKLVVPSTRLTGTGWEYWESEYERQRVVDARLRDGGYWRWDGPTPRRHEEGQHA